LFHERLGGRRVFGVTANLYSLRGEGGLGYGDLGDLRRLQELVASWGGDFVALNPLHALRNRGEDISPYSPVSRLWRNLLYLDIEAIPEFAGCARARDLLESPQAAESVRELRAAERLDQEAVLELKLKLLRELHRSFAGRERSSGSERGRAYAQFLDDGSTALVDFATFETLATLRKEGPDWRLWPESLRDPRGAAVLAFRREHSEAVDLHCWIQFELERQLEEAARAGRDAGLALGLIGDLAVGTPAHSADAWANKHLFARGVSLGAPPDAFSTEGQNWGLAPLDPNRLAEDGFSFWTRLVRASLRHAGGLRIDHAIGLQRSFWIPDGRPGSEGAYVLQPTEELLGILALEAQRSAALLIGEDLGVVPVDLGQRLASWGVLSTRVLLFERDGPTFRAPRTYSPRAFVSATTHDLVPLAGYVDGSDLSLRGPLEGQDEAALEHSLAGRRDDLGHLERALDEAGVPPGEFAERLHRFLAPCPAALLALCLDDVAGEREPINLPGISTARHRSWSRRMTRPLESFVLDREVVGPRARVIAPGT
ncbi:MAG: 4-alpha-glucanotransferase, partial [Planctomycetota bacterium]